VQIQSSFVAEDANHFIKIKKSSLKKAFMLIPSARSSGLTPRWDDYRPLLVSFERSGNQLGLFELSTQNIYEEIPSDRLIQTFKVKAEDADTITFDWAFGIKAVPAKKTYDLPGGGSKDRQAAEDGFVDEIQVVDSFVRSVSFDETTMEIEQVSRVKGASIGPSHGGSTNSQNAESTLSFQFQIRPYVENKKFQESIADEQGRVGFFTVTTSKKKELSSTIVHNMKWDVSSERGPITYALTKEIPANIQNAAAEGVLYWNKVFGREVVRVLMNADTLMKPQDRTVIVRWINWEDAGFAYASLQADPLTGEVLRGQIYLTSAFTQISPGVKTIASKFKSISPAPAGFSSAVTCQLTDLTAPELIHGKNVAARMLQDEIRMVVAHEAGHTLGLRHNFAGSHTAPISTKDLVAKEAEYLRDSSAVTQVNQGAPTTSSIMDYVNAMDGWMIGAYIFSQPLPYDQMAIDFAYNGNLAVGSKSLEFCTDEHISIGKMLGANVYGCERFDKKPNPILAMSLNAGRAQQIIIPTQYESLLEKLFAGKEVVTDQEVDNAITSDNYWYNFSNTDLMNSILFSKKGSTSDKVLSIKKTKYFYNKYLEYASYGMGPDSIMSSLKGDLYDEMDSDAKDIVKSDLLDAGGIGGILRKFLSISEGANKLDLSWSQKQVEQLFSSNNGDQLNGTVIVKGKEQKYSLTNSQFEKLKAHLVTMGKDYQKQSVYSTAQIFSLMSETKFKANIGQEQWAADYVDLAYQLLMLSESTLKTNINGKAVELPVPVMPSNTRVGILNMIQPTGLSFSGAGVLKQQVLRKVQAQFIPILQALGENVLNITSAQIIEVKSKYDGKIPAEVSSWLSAEAGILLLVEGLK
jgi:hypothetical protein